MLSRENILEILRESQVLSEGHFLLTSGKHSDRYMQCAKVFRRATYSETLCRELALPFQDQNIDVVIGPAMGAVQMAYEVSRQLGCENFFTEREEGRMVLRRGFAIVPGMRCLLVEDVVTTGGSIKEVKTLVEEAGGVVVAIGCLVDRSSGQADFGATPLHAVIQVEVEAWAPEDCPLCREGKIPLVKPGSRKTAGTK